MLSTSLNVFCNPYSLIGPSTDLSHHDDDDVPAVAPNHSCYYDMPQTPDPADEVSPPRYPSPPQIIMQCGSPDSDVVSPPSPARHLPGSPTSSSWHDEDFHQDNPQANGADEPVPPDEPADEPKPKPGGLIEQLLHQYDVTLADQHALLEQHNATLAGSSDDHLVKAEPHDHDYARPPLPKPQRRWLSQGTGKIIKQEPRDDVEPPWKHRRWTAFDSVDDDDSLGTRILLFDT